MLPETRASSGHAGTPLFSEAERSGILALHAILRKEDPNHERLGLKRMPTYTGDFLWLCEKHYAEAESKIPDRIE